MVLVPRNKPLQGKLAIDALSHETRVAIIKRLLEERQGLTASELAEAFNLAIPTILSHLELLESAGIVRFELRSKGGRVTRLYTIPDPTVSIQLDLEAYVRVPTRARLDELMLQYLSEKMKAFLPMRFTVDDISQALKMDRKTAMIILDHIAANEGEVVKLLVPMALKALRRGERVTLAELGRRLKVDEYWAAKVAASMESKGYCTIKEGRIQMYAAGIEEAPS